MELRLVAAVSSVLWVGCERPDEPRPAFKPATWRQAHEDSREPMARELIRTGRLKGLTSAQVTELLGPSQRTNRFGAGDFNYIVGPSVVDDLWLTVKFKDDVATEAVITSD